jgi:hypothetical protein
MSQHILNPAGVPEARCWGLLLESLIDGELPDIAAGNHVAEHGRQGQGHAWLCKLPATAARFRVS